MFLWRALRPWALVAAAQQIKTDKDVPKEQRKAPENKMKASATVVPLRPEPAAKH